MHLLVDKGTSEYNANLDFNDPNLQGRTFSKSPLVLLIVEYG